MLGHASADFQVVQIQLSPEAETQNYTRGTGQQTIDSKYVVDTVPVVSNSTLNFTQIQNLTYQALLYELREQDGQTVAPVSPNWFGVAIPNPANFDLSSDVDVVLYFHPEPAQAGFSNADYFNKNGANGTDWKQLFAFADRLGGQMAGAD